MGIKVVEVTVLHRNCDGLLSKLHFVCLCVCVGHARNDVKLETWSSGTDLNVI